MRKNQSSLTAAGIAVARAVESEKPAEQRICFDPFARKFVPAWMYFSMGWFIKNGYAEWRSPGVNGFLMARERYIDDVLQDYVNQGMQQLVILGAGFDSRAYRSGLSGDVTVFEVDHPATQADKIKKLNKILHRFPDQVTFVPVDFNTQSLSECLFASGYDPAPKSLFIWQGVTMYLTPEAIDDTLAFVVKNSASGSAIVFDYLYQNVLDGSQKQSEVSSMRRYRFMTGEGLTFGIPEGTAESFLLERGFSLAKDVSTPELKERYFLGQNAGRRIVGGYGIVIGQV